MTQLQHVEPGQVPLTDDERFAKLAELRRSSSSRLLESQAKKIRAAEARLKSLREEQTQQLVAGRRSGLSWAQLAALSGVSRQAVQERVNAVLMSSD